MLTVLPVVSVKTCSCQCGLTPPGDFDKFVLLADFTQKPCFFFFSVPMTDACLGLLHFTFFLFVHLLFSMPLATVVSQPIGGVIEMFAAGKKNSSLSAPHQATKQKR